MTEPHLARILRAQTVVRFGVALGFAREYPDPVTALCDVLRAHGAHQCLEPHPDTQRWPDVRCTRHYGHPGDHGGFPQGPALAAVPIRWSAEPDEAPITEWCSDRMPGMTWMECTRLHGHDGVHQAGSVGESVLAHWPQR